MGSGNPPDKPGYAFLQLTGDPTLDNTKINDLADEGYRFEAAINGAYILLANYKKDA